MTQLLHQFQKPPTVAAGFYTRQRRHRQAAIKLLPLAVAVDQLPLFRFAVSLSSEATCG
jgi:hypothetical protein